MAGTKEHEDGTAIPMAGHQLIKQLYQKEYETFQEYGKSGKHFYRTYTAHDWDGTVYEYGEPELKMSPEATKVKIKMITQWQKIWKGDKGAHKVMDQIGMKIPGLISEAGGKENCEYTFELDYAIDEKENDPDEYFEALCSMRRNVLAQPFYAAQKFINEKGDQPPNLTIKMTTTCALCFVFTESQLNVAWNLIPPERETKHAWNSFFSAKPQGASNKGKPKMNCVTKPPAAFEGMGLGDDDNSVWIFFGLNGTKHLAGDALLQNCNRIIDLPYQMKYHASCAEAYIHTKMRAHTRAYIQVLNRGDIPDKEVKKLPKKKKGGKAPAKKKGPAKKKKGSKK